MESLERLFGREITNVDQQGFAFNNQNKNRPSLRSMSFCGGQGKNIAVKPRSSINPNISQKIQKPKFSKEIEQEQYDLKESLTDYFDESMSFMLLQ